MVLPILQIKICRQQSENPSRLILNNKIKVDENQIVLLLEWVFIFYLIWFVQDIKCIYTCVSFIVIALAAVVLVLGLHSGLRTSEKRCALVGGHKDIIGAFLKTNKNKSVHITPDFNCVWNGFHHNMVNQRRSFKNEKFTHFEFVPYILDVMRCHKTMCILRREN